MNVLLQSVGGYSVEGLLFITYTRPAVPAEQPPTHIFKLQVQVCCVFLIMWHNMGFVFFFAFTHSLLLLAEGDFEVFRLLSRPSLLCYRDDL